MLEGMCPGILKLMGNVLCSKLWESFCVEGVLTEICMVNFTYLLFVVLADCMGGCVQRGGVCSGLRLHPQGA